MRQTLNSATQNLSRYGYDCGIAVITFAEKIMKDYANVNSLTELNLSNIDLTKQRKY